jgi:signal transduction histidine kinase
MRTPSQLLRLCGVGIVLISTVFSVVELLGNADPNRAPGSLWEIFGHGLGFANPLIALLQGLFGVGFCLIFLYSTRPDILGRSRPGALALLSAQAVIGIGLGPELMGLVSCGAAFVLARIPAQRFVAAVVVLQTGGIYLQTVLSGVHPLEKLIPGSEHHLGLVMALMAATTVVWHGLTFSLGLFGVAERQRAQELARANAELAASRHLDAETARVAVRLGISRDLHDASGHHLTALNVNLRLMRHLEDPEVRKQKIDECLFLVGRLLQDVRVVVKDLRSLQRIDLRSILQTMCAGFEGLRVHLELDDELAQAEPYYAHTLFRCAQEILTNIAKHAAARNAWLTLRRDEVGYFVEGRDDGRGVSQIHFGHGLTGMRERVLEFGGDFEAHSRVGEGFMVRLTIPVRRIAA